MPEKFCCTSQGGGRPSQLRKPSGGCRVIHRREDPGHRAEIGPRPSGFESSPSSSVLKKLRKQSLLLLLAAKTPGAPGAEGGTAALLPTPLGSRRASAPGPVFILRNLTVQSPVDARPVHPPAGHPPATPEATCMSRSKEDFSREEIEPRTPTAPDCSLGAGHQRAGSPVFSYSLRWPWGPRAIVSLLERPKPFPRSTSLHICVVTVWYPLPHHLSESSSSFRPQFNHHEMSSPTPCLCLAPVLIVGVFLQAPVRPYVCTTLRPHHRQCPCTHLFEPLSAPCSVLIVGSVPAHTCSTLRLHHAPSSSWAVFRHAAVQCLVSCLPQAKARSLCFNYGCIPFC